MSLDKALRAQAPADLRSARSMTHKAVQLLTRAARANLPAKPDDSHSNMGWEAARGGFVTHALPASQGDVFVYLSVSPLRLELIKSNAAIAAFPIDGYTYAQVSDWLDLQLTENGLNTASNVELPYELPGDVAAVAAFDTTACADQLTALSAWFELAARALLQFAKTNASLGPGEVRCWPHHFDIATYVQLEDGDFETARGIGVGMSPGDESYDQPYFYINPWPHLNADNLPTPPPPGHWHSDGFVGAIATGDDVLTLPALNDDLATFIASAFSIGHDQLES